MSPNTSETLKHSKIQIEIHFNRRAHLSFNQRNYILNILAPI